MRRWLGRLVLAAVAAWVVSLPFRIALYSEAHVDRADAAVVPGAAVWTDRPTPVLAARLDHAAALYRTGRVRLVVTTGGRAEGDRVSEGAAARAYLVGRGVPAGAVRADTLSRSTAENFRAAARLLAGPGGYRRVAVVTDPLHSRRAVTLARAAGLDAYPAPTPTTRYRGLRVWARFLARETLYLAATDLRLAR